jgi:SAM-dependent methyltransferase
MSESPSDARYWESHWERPTQGWEIGRAAPPLERWFDAHSPRGRRALVVGCGRGHEARMLAARGADVVAVDFAPTALAEARALAAAEKLPIDFRQRDLFALAKDPDRYDLVVEHCCFCAIDPVRRPEYVDVVADVLADGGELVGLYWNHNKPGGPPFTVDNTELQRLFAARFVLKGMSVPDDSIERRRGQEILAQLYRR